VQDFVIKEEFRRIPLVIDVSDVGFWRDVNLVLRSRTMGFEISRLVPSTLHSLRRLCSPTEGTSDS